MTGNTGDLVRVEFEVVDPTMGSLVGDRYLRRLWTGARWAEGPAYFPAARYLVFSDIPNDRVLRFDELTGTTTEFLSPAGFANGHTVDRCGRLLSAEHGTRRVTRLEHDGSFTVLADEYGGHRLNSPNDLVEAADGAIWFTDPAYGIDSDYEGHAAVPEQDGCHVYRVVPGEQPSLVADDFDRPNGLAFSLDGTTLYVSDSARRHLRRFAVDGAGLSGGEVIAECPEGTFDGLRLDSAGRIWISSGRGVEVLSGDGHPLAVLRVPEVVSNLTFGGPRGHDLYLTATTSLYVVRLKVTGPPLR